MRALWMLIGSILILTGFVLIYQYTQTLMFATVFLGLGITGLVVSGGGLVPGWTLLLAIPIMVAFLWLRPKVPV